MMVTLAWRGRTRSSDFHLLQIAFITRATHDAENQYFHGSQHARQPSWSSSSRREMTAQWVRVGVAVAGRPPRSAAAISRRRLSN